LVKDIAMHIAASSPQYVSVDDVPESIKKEAEAEFAEKAEKEGKPKEMIPKIIEGQVKKYLGEKTLLEQPFVKNPDQTVGEVVKQANAKLGENIVVRRFSRIALGEVA
jgi:elongation factor Ts